MPLYVWIPFLALLAFLEGREILTLGEARREGRATRREFRRFRRRSLGLFVLLVLAGMNELGDHLEFANPFHELAYWGSCFVALIWLLIIAARDANEIAQGYVEAQQESALQAIVAIEEQLAAKDPDRRPIPSPTFPPGQPANEPEDGKGP